MSGFRPDTEVTLEDTFFFFFFKAHLFSLRGGREGCCKQITLACARSASATLGLPPVHGACSLPAHAAQALGCSAGNHPWPALGCLHFPGPSCSGSGTRVVLRGADSRLGLRFVPFPDPSSSGDEVFGVRAIAATYRLPAARLSRCAPAHLLSRCCPSRPPRSFS